MRQKTSSNANKEQEDGSCPDSFAELVSVRHQRRKRFCVRRQQRTKRGAKRLRRHTREYPAFGGHRKFWGDITHTHTSWCHYSAVDAPKSVCLVLSLRSIQQQKNDHSRRRRAPGPRDHHLPVRQLHCCIGGSLIVVCSFCRHLFRKIPFSNSIVLLCTSIHTTH